MVEYFPFNSMMVDGVPDRPANAETLAAYLGTFFANGVVMRETTSLQVKAKSGLTVQIMPGAALIDGKMINCTSVEEFTLDSASGSLSRIDRLVFRLDTNNRLMQFAVLKGTPGSTPVAPALQRSGGIYDMCLAEIRIPASATALTQSNILDTRANAELCGISAATVEPPESTAVYVDATMLASKWSGNVYDFTAEYPGESYNIDVAPSDLCTDEQIKAWGLAMIVGSSTNNTCKAYGYVPEVDIPITIKAVRKAGGE